MRLFVGFVMQGHIWCLLAGTSFLEKHAGKSITCSLLKSNTCRPVTFWLFTRALWCMVVNWSSVSWPCSCNLSHKPSDTNPTLDWSSRMAYCRYSQEGLSLCLTHTGTIIQCSWPSWSGSEQTLVHFEETSSDGWGLDVWGLSVFVDRWRHVRWLPLHSFWILNYVLESMYINAIEIYITSDWHRFDLICSLTNGLRGGGASGTLERGKALPRGTSLLISAVVLAVTGINVRSFVARIILKCCCLGNMVLNFLPQLCRWPVGWDFCRHSSPSNHLALPKLPGQEYPQIVKFHTSWYLLFNFSRCVGSNCD